MRLLLLPLLLLLLAPLAAAAPLALRVDAFERSQVLSPWMTIYWNVDSAANNITIAVVAQTTGWVGFGLSANGGMYGADVFVFLNNGGKWALQDRFASGFFEPNLDASQDLQLLDYGQNSTATFFVLSRNVTTCDPEDFNFNEQGNAVIFAHGSSPAFGYHGPNSRGASYVHFLDNPVVPPIPSDAQRLQIRMPNVSIPDNETDYYVCTAAKLPADRKYQVVQRGPIIDNTPFVHHMLVYSCLSPPPLSNGETWPCFSMVSQCSGAFSGWAPGAGNFSFPADAGLPFGTADTVLWVVLQVHYNNVAFVGGQYDSSGFEFVYTAQLRQYDVGSVILGANLPLINLPPGDPAAAVTAQCASGCFDQYLPPAGVKILSLGFHMHLLGRKSWVQHIRNGQEIGNVSAQNWFNFNYQASQPIAYNETLMPGDALISHCVWDTTTAANYTQGGEDTGDEMCYQFLLYYPATPVRVCIDISDVIPQSTYCATAKQILSHEWSNSTHIPYDAPYVPAPATPCLA